MGRRVTQEIDVQRLAERIWNYSGGRIKSKDDFDFYYDEYMGEDISHKQDRVLRQKTFSAMSKRHNIPGFTERISPKRRTVTRLKKDTMLRRDMGITLKKTRDKGFDIVAKVGNRQVFARKTTDKTGQKHLRDKRGRFAKKI